jgi:hypothetical protein
MSPSKEKVTSIVSILDKVASSAENKGLLKEAEELDIISNTLEKMAKNIPAGDNRPAAIFPSTHPKVNDGKDHYPIPDKNHGRSALQRLSQFKDSKPSWWDGSVEELKNAIVRAVKGKFPGMEIEKEKFKSASDKVPIIPKVEEAIHKFIRIRSGDYLLDTILSGDKFIKNLIDVDSTGDGDNEAVLKHLQEDYKLNNNDSEFILNSLIRVSSPD